MRSGKALRVCALLMAAALAGCSSAGFGRTGVAPGFQQTAAQAHAQCKQLFADPAIDPIRQKAAVASIEQDTTSEMKMNREFPTSSDKPAIARWLRARGQCNQLMVAVRMMIGPQERFIVETHEKTVDLLIAELYLGRIDYGTFATRYMRVYFEMKWAVQTQIAARVINEPHAAEHAQQISTRILVGWTTLAAPDALERMRAQTTGL
ncbi:MAG TPA: hypothetical protein VGH16_22575 [Candidatus Binatia bacterium]